MGGSATYGFILYYDLMSAVTAKQYMDGHDLKGNKLRVSGRPKFGGVSQVKGEWERGASLGEWERGRPKFGVTCLYWLT